MSVANHKAGIEIRTMANQDLSPEVAITMETILIKVEVIILRVSDAIIVKSSDTPEGFVPRELEVPKIKKELLMQPWLKMDVSVQMYYLLLQRILTSNGFLIQVVLFT